MKAINGMRCMLLLLLLLPCTAIVQESGRLPLAHAPATSGILLQDSKAGHLRKVVAGGQTGVDQAGLRAARQVGLETGGWCPPDCKSLDGPIPPEFGLKPTPEEKSTKALEVPRSLRTEWNVRDSDATLIFRQGIAGCTNDPEPSLFRNDPGTAFTVECAEKYTPRPLLVCDPDNSQTAPRIIQWIRSHSIETLNVAGPAEQTSRGIGKRAEKLFLEVFTSFARR
jgi:hypothetical protein